MIGSYFAEVIQHCPAQPEGGYLNVRFGENLTVLYVGCHGDERGWLYARRQGSDNSNNATNNEGWLPAAATSATVKKAVPVAFTMDCRMQEVCPAQYASEPPLSLKDTYTP